MTPFGTTKSGEEVKKITLSAHGLHVTILTYGAIVQDVRLDGVDHSLTIGSDMISDYESAMQYFGCVVAPVANRLSEASAVIAGERHTLEANLEGQHTLHGGSRGAQSHVWKVVDSGMDFVVLSHVMPNLRSGFPGNRTIVAHFSLSEGPTLQLLLTTTTDAPSIANATNHSYWNLNEGSGIRGHVLKIAADHYLPTDHQGLVTGEIRTVSGTSYDFRSFVPLTPTDPPLDHTFCVALQRGQVLPRLWVEGTSGVSMTVSTSEPGIHIYDARDSAYCGIAIEAQSWPDAPNKPAFPGIEVTPDKPVVQVTEWRFKAP